MPRALVVVHETDPLRQRRIPGTVLPALAEQGVDAEIATFMGGGRVPDPADRDLVVVMGSAHAAYDDSLPWLAPELAFLRRAVDVGTPVLGICFGGQALARALGGTVGRAPEPERGLVDLDTLRPDVLPAGRWMEFHYDAFTLPPGAEELSRNAVALQAFALGPHLGLQFHPEITPDVFDAWFESKPSDVRAAVAAEVDLDAVRAELVTRADELADACRSLVADFLARADLPSAA
ncbi:type 1 glutamine amidotransferase [Pseudonocardia halophobica]|uniref:Glutamine amidotransferase n=1 Tax=Pseudonocardia halophobica TaxID=29401 RepID=A0A9W6P048_9PSEU|nr:type 1 glutamine amidotransferase [Pseudonocardia halophobica]GLL15346.1 glutamine amidotransferase [Pseudonocardia halophobica]